MELSLFSRDVIAMATAVALSHDMFDAALFLGICDKIVPGLLIGALRFGHLPASSCPAGRCPAASPTRRRARSASATPRARSTRAELLEAEAAVLPRARHLHLLRHRQLQPDADGDHGPAPAGRQLRRARHAAARRADRAPRCAARRRSPRWATTTRRSAASIDERAIVNGVVGLLATGGSTNHTLHLVAIARAAGIDLRWEDFDELSAAVPLLARIYPNGYADVNQFHAAGGMPFLIGELLDAGPAARRRAHRRRQRPRRLSPGAGARRGRHARLAPAPAASGDRGVLRAASEPFRADGGLRLLAGNLGRAVIKMSAVPDDRLVIEAPARVFDDQDVGPARLRARANSTAISSRSCASRARAPTACPNCTS